MKKESSLSTEQIDRVIEMAWEDRTPFDAILIQFGLKEEAVIKLMRSEMKSSSFKMWRTRVQGRKTKHLNQHMKARKTRLTTEKRIPCVLTISKHTTLATVCILRSPSLESQ